MENTNCDINRGRYITLGILFALLTLALLITGFWYVPVLFFILAAVSFGVSLKLFFVQRDVTCLMP